jgi:hypothetical protein
LSEFFIYLKKKLKFLLPISQSSPTISVTLGCGSKIAENCTYFQSPTTASTGKFSVCRNLTFPFAEIYRAVLTHRQGRHLPGAPDFKGPPNSSICVKIEIFVNSKMAPKRTFLDYCLTLTIKKFKGN